MALVCFISWAAVVGKVERWKLSKEASELCLGEVGIEHGRGSAPRFRETFLSSETFPHLGNPGGSNCAAVEHGLPPNWRLAQHDQKL